MSQEIEIQGKTVDEAVSEALLQLGARQDEVEITVLEEGKSGFLGVIGTRPARVRVTRKVTSHGPRRRGGRSRARSQPRNKQQAGRTGDPGRQRFARGGAGKPTAASRTEGAADGNVAPGIKAVSRVEPLASGSTEGAPAILEKVATELMRRSEFPCRCEVQEGDYHLVKITTDERSAGVLIGRHGTTVDAIEHLVERMTSQAMGERVRMNLDINNYRRRRESMLIERARNAIAKVESTGREVHLEPLCARERRIVHLEVTKVAGMRTYTVATAGGKHVVVARDNGSTGPPDSEP